MPCPLPPASHPLRQRQTSRPTSEYATPQLPLSWHPRHRHQLFVSCSISNMDEVCIAQHTVTNSAAQTQSPSSARKVSTAMGYWGERGEKVFLFPAQNFFPLYSTPHHAPPPLFWPAMPNKYKSPSESCPDYASFPYKLASLKGEYFCV